MLLNVLKTVREAVGPEFPVAVKLNSADFQRGGFAFEESLQVAEWLEEGGIDLIEISGGTYEQPKLVGIEGFEPEEPQNVKASTRMREAYFVDFAIEMRERVKVPLMVTGGFRRRDVIEEAVRSGAADLVGLGRPMCVDTDAPRQLLSGVESLERYEDRLRGLPSWLGFLDRIDPVRVMAAFSVMYWYYAQMDEIAHTGEPRPGMSVLGASRRILSRHRRLLKNR